jgi:phage tail P2-like protein
LEDIHGARLDALPAPLRPLWSPADCPPALLPWLAWSLSLDMWCVDWPVSRQRAAIAAAIPAHLAKGTPESLRAACRAAGWGEITITEGRLAWSYGDTDVAYGDPGLQYGAAYSWAEYDVQFAGPLSALQQAQARALLQRIAPARCRLADFGANTPAWLYGDESVAYGDPGLTFS